MSWKWPSKCFSLQQVVQAEHKWELSTHRASNLTSCMRPTRHSIDGYKEILLTLEVISLKVAVSQNLCPPSSEDWLYSPQEECPTQGHALPTSPWKPGRNCLQRSQAEGVAPEGCHCGHSPQSQQYQRTNLNLTVLGHPSKGVNRQARAGRQGAGSHSRDGAGRDGGPLQPATWSKGLRCPVRKQGSPAFSAVSLLLQQAAFHKDKVGLHPSQPSFCRFPPQDTFLLAIT